MRVTHKIRVLKDLDNGVKDLNGATRGRIAKRTAIGNSDGRLGRGVGANAAAVAVLVVGRRGIEINRR